MLSNHRIQTTLNEIKEISRIDLALYNENGQLLAATYDHQAGFESAVKDFVHSMAESQTFAGFHFFKVMAEDEVDYILLVHSSTEEAYMVGKLATCQVRNLAEAYREQADRNHLMQNILLGNLLLVDLYNQAKKFHIEQAERVVYVIEVEQKTDILALKMLKGMFGGLDRDFVTEVDEQSIVVVKDVCDLEDDADLEAIAKSIVDNLQSEAMVRVRVGYGNRVNSLQDLPKSYQEAKMAIEVGKVFYVEKETIAYSKLGIGRLIYQIPMQLCEMFIHEIFGTEIPDVFSEENMVTIQKFFENNLNISETARQLFVHRNTLVYRLERLEKAIGLDIRRFEDAMTFKIAMMVLAHMSYQKGIHLIGGIDHKP